MWSKLSHLVKPRPGDSVLEGVSSEIAEGGNEGFTRRIPASMSRIYDIPANPFASDPSNVHDSTPNLINPPASPSKASKRSLFRRSLKAKLLLNSSQQDLNNDASESDPALKLAPKKKRAGLQVDTFVSRSPDTVPFNPAPSGLPQTPTAGFFKAKDEFDPNVEVQPSGNGSIRSILRDKNTPGTGQSVRFFSRDVYRVISPDVSQDIDESVPPKPPFWDKYKEGSQGPSYSPANTDSTIYHSTVMSPQNNVDMILSPANPHSRSRKPIPFPPRHPAHSRNLSLASSRSSHSATDSLSFGSHASPSSSSLIIPNLPPDMSDLMEDHGCNIPDSVEGSLQVASKDSSIKGIKQDNEPSGVSESDMKTIRRSSGSGSTPALTATPNPKSAPPNAILSSNGTPSHSRVAPGTPLKDSFSPDSRLTNETTFFTPENDKRSLFILPTPPQFVAPVQDIILPEEIETYSHEELLACMRQQLFIQQQLASQFEVDLLARDELVRMLSQKLQGSEAVVDRYRKEVEKRKESMRSLRRKVADLERVCRGLEEEVDRSREESFERSVMDEASEGALVVLQGNIGQLKAEIEQAKAENSKTSEERDALQQDVATLRDELQASEDLKGTLASDLETMRNDNERLQEEVESLSQAVSEAQDGTESMKSELEETKQLLDEERNRRTLAEAEWNEVRQNLEAQIQAQGSMVDEIEVDAIQRTLQEKEEEIKTLREEVEAQWGNAEKADEKIKFLEGEKEGLAKSVQSLDVKIEEIGSQWKECDVKRAELEEELNEVRALKDEIEHERDQLVEDVNFEREHSEEMTQTLEACQNKIQELEQERQYAADNIGRLEKRIRQRDSELTATQAQIEADRDVRLGSMQEQLSILDDEVERLKRHIHDLQQESADKEVKIIQLTKARAQDKEDREGLNIALDSKQQELELLKRKLGLKGTAGSTPAISRLNQQDVNSRRQSFATPSIRPKLSTLSKPLVPDTPETTVKPTVRPGNRGSASTRMPPPSRTSVPISSLSRSTSSSLAKSTSLTSSTRTRSSIPAAGMHFRSSSVMSSSTTVSHTESEKENAPVKKSSRERASMVPA